MLSIRSVMRIRNGNTACMCLYFIVLVDNTCLLTAKMKGKSSIIPGRHLNQLTTWANTHVRFFLPVVLNSHTSHSPQTNQSVTLRVLPNSPDIIYEHVAYIGEHTINIHYSYKIWLAYICDGKV